MAQEIPHFNFMGWLPLYGAAHADNFYFSNKLWAGLWFVAFRISKSPDIPIGIIYLSQHDAIIVSLIDGTYHIIGYVSQNPTLLDTVEQATSSSATSKSLSSVARAVFLIAEDHEVERPKDGSEPPKTYPNHVGRIGCALGVDSGNVVAWIYQ